MSIQVLPPDPTRAKQYQVSNFVAVKVLLPDGSVVDGIPVDVSGTVRVLNSLVPEEFDNIVGNYTGTDLTQCLYYNKGVLVATVNITYISIGSPAESYFKSAQRID